MDGELCCALPDHVTLPCQLLLPRSLQFSSLDCNFFLEILKDRMCFPYCMLISVNVWVAMGDRRPSPPIQSLQSPVTAACCAPQGAPRSISGMEVFTKNRFPSVPPMLITDSAKRGSPGSELDRHPTFTTPPLMTSSVSHGSHSILVYTAKDLSDGIG